MLRHGWVLVGFGNSSWWWPSGWGAGLSIGGGDDSGSEGNDRAEPPRGSVFRRWRLFLLPLIVQIMDQSPGHGILPLPMSP